MQNSLYSIEATQEFIRILDNNYGYTCVQIKDGVLGLGDWILISPDENHANYIINEVYYNEGNSVQKISIQASLSAKNKQALAELGYAY